LNCILINPWTKCVDDAVFDPEDVATLQRALTSFGHAVTNIAVRASFPNTDNLIIEHPNQLSEADPLPVFKLGSIIVQGCGVIMGVDGDKWVEPKFMKVQIQDWIRFS